jgi:hypothetical protein
MTQAQSSIPQSVLATLFDCTGSKSVGRGFLMFYVNDQGDISYISHTESQVINKALLADATKYIDKMHGGPPEFS